MEKTYHEQAISFILKAVLSLGSVYLITEKFIGQIDHLFHLESIRTALSIFHLIYFVLPIAVVSIYFFFKSDSLQIFKARTNLIIACLAAVYMTLTAFAIIIPTRAFIYIGGLLMFLTLGFLIWAMFKRDLKAHKKQVFQYLTLAFLVILFAFAYLIRNDRRATKYEAKYFSNLDQHFVIMDTVSNYLASIANTFQPETSAKLDSLILIKYFAQTDKDSMLYSVDSNELIRISRNRWGLHINLISYKSLLILLPFAGFMLGMIFLFGSSRPLPDEKILLRKNSNDEYEVIDPPPSAIQEKEFLKVMFVTLVTLTIPVLHPLESIQSTFTKPVSFSDSAIPKQLEVVHASSKSSIVIQVDTLKQFSMKGSGNVYIVMGNKTTRVDSFSTVLKLDSIKTALNNMNNNLILFSSFFGDNDMVSDPNFMKGSSSSVSPELYYIKRRKKMKNEIFKK